MNPELNNWKKINVERLLEEILYTKMYTIGVC